MRRVAVLVFLFSTAARPGSADTAEWSEQSEKTLSAQGVTTVRVENARGFIHVGPSTDGRIHLKVLKVMALESPLEELEGRESIPLPLPPGIVY